MLIYLLSLIVYNAIKLNFLWKENDDKKVAVVMAGCLLMNLANAQNVLSQPVDNLRFGQEIITGDRLKQGADASGAMFVYCIESTWYKLGVMFPKMSRDDKVAGVLDICQPRIEEYQVYNILMAADDMGEPKSEQQAWHIYQKNRQDGTNKVDLDLQDKIKIHLATLNDQTLEDFLFIY